jgi:hypothetical protein
MIKVRKGSELLMAETTGDGAITGQTGIVE